MQLRISSRELMKHFDVLQDKGVAFKIFELGLKKFGQHPDYVSAYIDYMSHLNGKRSLRPAAAVKL